MNEENIDIPLKRFVSCDHCGKPLRGYIVKKKNIYYYKCNTKACGNNKNANALNTSFAKILEVFKVNTAKDFLQLLRRQVIATFNQLTSGKQDAYEDLQRQYKELTIKINRLEERYIEEEISGDLYKKYRDIYNLEKGGIEQNLMKFSNQVSNLEKCIDLAFSFATELPLKWLSADYHTKQQMQFLLFPQGISYDKKSDGCRTNRINSVLLYIAYFQQIISKKQRGIPELNLDYASFAALVESSGNMSNFYEHCEAIVNFEKLVNNRVEGQYRKKKV